MDILRYYITVATMLVGIAGFMLGGPFVWLGASTFFVFLLFDLALPKDFAPRIVGSTWLADAPLFLQLPLLILFYAAFINSVIAGHNDLSSIPQILGTIASITYLSALPNLPIGHELLHRRHWLPRWISKVMGAFYGDPHRDVAHVLTHHIHLDTAKDTDSAVRGQTVYSFVFQATYHAYKDTVLGQAELLRRQGFSVWNWRNMVYSEVALVASIPLTTLYFAGSRAALVSIASIVSAKLLLEGLNYFQHYGLLRAEGAPVQLHHTWNHMGAVVRAVGVEITNHINHHVDGHTPFYALKPEPSAPQMPSLFLCFLLGVIPPVWFRYVAMPLLEDWDRRYATPAERELAMQANKRAGWPLWLEQKAT